MKYYRSSTMRAGLGFDSHLYSDKGTLVLGGLKFPSESALRGHSDGDAVLHAVIDALLGASGLGDIGDYFPDTSRKLKGISSRKLLQKIMRRLHAKKLQPFHLDVTIVADNPRLGPAKNKMKKEIARLTSLNVTQVNIKAKTLEGLHWFSPGDGVAVWAVATLCKIQRPKSKIQND